jgi:thiosulfate/3-mercaptopyruvate sulfurtransferase
MNKTHTLSMFILATMLGSGLFCSKEVNPVGYEENSDTGTDTCVVSTGRLDSNLNNNQYTIIDVRSPAEYAAGHIPRSVSIPFDLNSVWATSDFETNGLWVQLPEIFALTAALGGYGIASSSDVVLVTGLPAENPYSLGAPGRVALTLAYAGVSNVKILDGAFEKWAGEGKSVSTDTASITAVDFEYEGGADIIVDIDYVIEKQGKVVLVDARDAAVYAGEVTEPWALKEGHIPTAVSLPAATLWNVADGTMKPLSELQALAGAVVGIKVFDGAAQEWAMTFDMVK